MIDDIWSIDPATRPFRLEPPARSFKRKVYFGQHKIGELSIASIVHDPCGLNSSATISVVFDIGNDDRAKRIQDAFGEWLNEQMKNGLQ